MSTRLPDRKAMRKRSVWVEPLFAEGKDWHGMRRFRLRRLWRVNCEALMRAAGQNLKRLLKKRGWGRRPFPAEAGGGMAPPDWEEVETDRKDTQKRKRAWVSVASLLSFGTTRTWLDVEISMFSHPLLIQIHFHIFSYVFFIVLLSALLHDAIPLKESERREPFLSQASSFPNKLYKRVFQQADELSDICNVLSISALTRGMLT